jgi:cellobiose-specific phosphotransferase system component IIA
MKKLAAAIVSVLLLSGCATATPARNVSAARHPNLAAAQRYCAQAFDKLDAAQRANEWDLGGHAKRAKELLVQASDEIKLAAVAANQKGH